MEEKKRYVVIKEMDHNGQKLHVIILDGMSEVLEFETEAEALKFAQLLEVNSDSGWSYKVRGI